MIELKTRLLNPAGWELLEAAAINDGGEIAGTGSYNGQQQAFVLLPRKSPFYLPFPCGGVKAIDFDSAGGGRTATPVF